MTLLLRFLVFHLLFAGATAQDNFNLYPQNSYQTQNYGFSMQPGPEEDLKRVIVMGAYAAAFGAALGASILPFRDPGKVSYSRTILGGASLGFVIGSAYAFSLVAMPTGPSESFGYDQSFGAEPRPQKDVGYGLSYQRRF